MRKYHSFREYFIQCNIDGRVKHEKCVSCGATLLICKSYGGQCSSAKCKGLRWPQEISDK